MSSSNRRRARTLAAGGLLLAAFASPSLAEDKGEMPKQPGMAFAPRPLGIGTPIAKDAIKAWDIDVRPDGHGLPAGKGSVKQGEALYQERCAACHGEFGEGKDRWPPLIGGIGKLTDNDPKKAVGNYWPYATTLFDYIKRAMPFGNAQSLADDEVYAITAYVLSLNDVVKGDAVLDRDALLKIRLPNAGNFIPDPRPDVKGTLCMTDCKGPAAIHSEARKIGVTPEDERNKKRPGVD